jgi:3-oxoacyl-[acyl-carrier protein] reductase
VGRLEGKVALITGSGRGIGRAIALKLAAEGADLVINDLDEGPAAETLAVLEGLGARARAVVGDVAHPDFAGLMTGEAVTAFGGIDIIVNNAGYIWNTTIQNTTDEQWAAMIDVHAAAPFRLLRAATPFLREAARRETAEIGRPRTRKIVNISSVSGLHGAATQIAYAAGKAALFGMTKSLAKEWGRYNVTVNCVAFGHIETRLTQPLEDGPRTIDIRGRDLKVGLDPATLERIRAATALGRPGTPEDAAGSVFLFCIPESDYVTGQILECSGGAAFA